MPSGRSFVPPPGQHETLDRMEEARNYNAWVFDRGASYLGRRTLDLGAGLGPFVAMLPEDAEIVALEPSEEFAERLRSRFEGHPNVRVVERDAMTFAQDSEPGQFDTILCFNVLEHIADDAPLLAELGRLLSDDGHLLLLVPAHERLYGEIDRRVGHERRYDLDLVRDRLQEAGLAVDDARYVNPLGALGWVVWSRLLRQGRVPPAKAYDRLVPLLRPLDRLGLPFGLSVWAVAHREVPSAR